MPLYEIQAPNGKKYRIEGPPGAEQDDIISAVMSQYPEAGTAPSIGGYIKETAKAIPRGVIGGLEQAAIGASALLPGEMEDPAVEGIKKFADWLKPKAAAGYEDAIPTKLGEAVGSMGSLLIPGGAVGLIARGSAAARIGTVGGLAGAMGAGESRERAKAEGADADQIREATQLGSAVGLSNIAPIERVFRMLPKEVKGGIFERLQRSLVTGGYEGLQESAEAIAQNMIAQNIYKPDQELLQGSGEQGAYGAGAGALVQFMVDAVAGRRARPVPKAAQPSPEVKQANDIMELAEGDPGYISGLKEKMATLTPGTPEYHDTAVKLMTWQFRTEAEDAPKAAESAFTSELPDLFGEFRPTPEQVGEVEPRPELELTGSTQMELPLEAKAAPEPEQAAKVTDSMLTELGFSRTSKKAREALRGLDISTAEGLQAFEEKLDDLSNRVKFNMRAASRVIDRARFQQARQSDFGFGAPEGATNELDQSGRGPAEQSVVVPVSPAGAGAGPVAGAGPARVDENTTAVGGRDAGEGTQRPALTDQQADELDLRKAEEVLSVPKNQMLYEDALVYLVDTASQKPADAQEQLSKKTAKRVLQRHGVPAGQVLAAKKSAEAMRKFLDKMSAQQEGFTATGDRAAERRAEKLVEDMTREFTPQETSIRQKAEVVKAARAAEDELAERQRSVKEKAEYARNSRRLELKAPDDVAFFTPEDAIALLDTYVSDAEAGNAAARKKKPSIARLGIKEAIDPEDVARIRDLMVKEQRDEAHSEIVKTVLRARTAAQAAVDSKQLESIYRKGFLQEGGKTYRLSHRPIGAPLSRVATRALKNENLKDALRDIAGSGSTPVMRVAAQKILNAIGKTKVKIRESPIGDPGVYSSVTDTIYIDPQALHEHTLLHEAMHAAVSHVLRNGNHLVTQKLRKLYEALSPQLKGAYGASNIQEFAAEAISNQEFQDALRTLPKNWWGRFVDAIRNLLGMSRANPVEKAINQLLEVAPSEARTSGIDLPLTGNATIDAVLPSRLEEFKKPGDVSVGQKILDLFDPSKAAQRAAWFRNQIVDVQGAVKEKLRAAGDSGTAPLVNMALASRSADLAVTSMLNGPIQLKKLAGSNVDAFTVEDGTSIAGVHKHIRDIADQLPGTDKKKKFEEAKALFGLAADVKRLKSMPADMQVRFKFPADRIAAGEEAVRLYGGPINAAMDDWTSYKNSLLEAARAAGRFTAEDVTAWQEAPDFVPWYRILDDAEHGHQVKSSAKQFFNGLRATGKMAELIGGDIADRPLGDTLNNMEQLSFWLVNSAVKNHAALRATDALLGIDAKKVGGPNAPGVDRARTIKVYRDGAEEFYELGDVLDADAFIGAQELISGPWLNMFRAGAAALRKGTTLMPGFIANQLFQDAFRATAYSGANSPFKVGANVMGEFAREMSGDAMSKYLAAYGIVGRPDYIFDDEKSRIAAALDETKTGATYIASRAFKMLDNMTRASDAAQRRSIHKQTMQETGDEGLALYRAIEIINFQTRGKSRTLTFLRQTIPFLNAYIQGMDVAYRAMSGRGMSMGDRKQAALQFYATGAKIAALSAAYTLLVGDDDEYQKTPDYVRMSGFILPGTRQMIKEFTGTDPGGNIKIPAPIDPAGLLFKILPESVINDVVRAGTADELDNSKFWRMLSAATINAISPPQPVPQVAKPLVELWANKSFFTGNPIVGQSMAGLDTSQQYTTSTTDFARVLGQYLPIAPVQIDHLARGMLGLAGGTMMFAASQLVGDSIAPERPSARLNEMPQIRTFLTGNAATGLKEDYYELREKATEVSNTVNRLAQRDPQQLREYLAKNDKLYAIAKSGVFTEVGNALRQLRQYRDLVDHGLIKNQNGTPLTSEDKRAVMDNIEKKEVELLSKINITALRKLAGM